MKAERSAVILGVDSIILSPLSSDEHPAEAAVDLLPHEEVVALTGFALTNHTVSDLLSMCWPGALVMVPGPSAPLSPVLVDYSVSILSGTLEVDEDAALRTVVLGAMFKQVGSVRLLALTHPAH